MVQRPEPVEFAREAEAPWKCFFAALKVPYRYHLLDFVYLGAGFLMSPHFL